MELSLRSLVKRNNLRFICCHISIISRIPLTPIRMPPDSNTHWVGSVVQWHFCFLIHRIDSITWSVQMHMGEQHTNEWISGLCFNCFFFRILVLFFIYKYIIKYLPCVERHLRYVAPAKRHPMTQTNGKQTMGLCSAHWEWIIATRAFKTNWHKRTLVPRVNSMMVLSENAICIVLNERGRTFEDGKHSQSKTPKSQLNTLIDSTVSQEIFLIPHFKWSVFVAIDVDQNDLFNLAVKMDWFSIKYWLLMAVIALTLNAFECV